MEGKNVAHCLCRCLLVTPPQRPPLRCWLAICALTNWSAWQLGQQEALCRVGYLGFLATHYWLCPTRLHSPQPFAKGQWSCLAMGTNHQVIAPIWRERWPRSATTSSSAVSAGESGAGSEIRLPRPSILFRYPQVFPVLFFFSMALWRLCRDVINACCTTSLPAVWCLVELLHNYHPPFMALKNRKDPKCTDSLNKPRFFWGRSFPLGTLSAWVKCYLLRKTLYKKGDFIE